MKSELEVLKKLACKEPGAMAVGYIIYSDSLKDHGIIPCTWEEALEKRQDCEAMINKKVVIIKVIMELVEPEESEIIKFEKELYPSNLKITKEQIRLLEDFVAEGYRVIDERKAEAEREAEDVTTPFAPSTFLMEMHEQIISSGVHRSIAVKRVEKRFNF